MDYLAPVLRIAEMNNHIEDGDYVNEDGLLCCGKCGTRRQARIQVPFAGGDGSKTLTVWVSCKCREDEARRAKQFEEDKHNLEALAQLRSHSLIRGKLCEATFDNFIENEKNSRYLKICKRYADSFDEMLKANQGLLFYGDVGTGKTFAAACIANSLLDRRIPVVMTSFFKIVPSMQSNMGAEESIVSKLNRAKLLIIDDLGAERDSAYAAERVYDIIDSRYTSNLPLILTTNLSLEEMKRCDDGKKKKIYDRIFELCHPVKFDGVSWRKKEAFKRATAMKEFLEG